MALRVYNTLTRKKTDLEPVEPGRVGIYLCGPTVYKKSHIGHAVGPVIFDAMRRWLSDRHGLQVTLVLNITDVDDKIIDEAKAQGCEMHEIAEEVTADYLRAMEALNVATPTHMPKATEHIEEIIALVQRLIDGGHAYVVDGDVYFDVTTFDGYGKLSRRSLEEQSVGTRELKSSEGKRHSWDFVLWKSAKEGEPSWPSPWGVGRPGWHIECSAMSMKYLGETFDIHGGGVDLVFPHHENEVAQSEAATGKPFAKYWVHNGLTRVSTRKMSKSVGNIRTLDELLGQYPGEVLRFFILSTHYRRPIDFSDEQIGKVTKGVKTFYRLFDRCREIAGQDPYDGTWRFDALPAADRSDVLDAVAKHKDAFAAAMDDDFNTAGAISELYLMANAINSFIEEGRLTRDSADEEKRALIAAVGELLACARVLGLFETRADEGVSDELTDSLIRLLIELREQARRDKQYALSDRVRDGLGELGILLKDTRDGTTWEKA